MPAAVIGIGLGAASLYEGSKASSAAAKAQQQSLDLQKQSLDFNKQRYSDYQSLYGAVNKQLVDQAQKGVQADLTGVTARAGADTAQAFANAQQAQARNDASFGIAPDSGRAEAAGTALGIGQATAAAGNISNQREAERRNAQTQTLALRENVANMGNSQLNNAAGAMDQATQGMANSYSNLSNTQANQANNLYSGGAGLIGMGLTAKSPAPASTTAAPAGGYNLGGISLNGSNSGALSGILGLPTAPPEVPAL